MKKKKIFLMTLSTLMCVGAGGGLYLLTSKKPAGVVASGEKATEYINITTADGFNGNFLFQIDKEMTINDNTGPFNYYLNGELKSFDYAVNNGSTGIICVPNSADKPTDDFTNYYLHYVLKAGTKIYSTSTTDYILENDYHWWRTTNQNNNGLDFYYQHGKTNGTGDIDSLKFTAFNGRRADADNRFWFQPSFEDTSAAWSKDADDWITRCPIYIDKGEGYISPTSSSTPLIWALTKTATSGTMTFLMEYSILFGGNSYSMDETYWSFYIPDGTLWGGFEHPFMIEGDYYFEITKNYVNDSCIHGFCPGPHDYKQLDDSNYYTCDRTTHGGTEYFIKNADETYTDISTYVTSANSWASDFLSKTATPCENLDANSFKSDSELWTGFNTSYTALSDTAKTIIKTNPYGNKDITNAIERYNYIVKKYNVTDFINGSTSSGSKTITRMPVSNDVVLLVTIIAIVGISSISGYLLLRKKKQ